MSFDIENFFKVTDSMQADNFCEFFHDKSQWTFANNPALEGKEQIHAMAQGFFDQLDGIAHQVAFHVRSGNTFIFDGTVTYNRKDKKIISLPFAGKIELVEDKISQYRTYIDLTPFLSDKEVAI